MALAMAEQLYFHEHFVFALDARIAIMLNASGGVIQATFNVPDLTHGVPDMTHGLPQTLPLVPREIEFIDVVETDPTQSYRF